MDFGFPLYIQLTGNNCMIFGGGDYAAAKAETLLRFGAKVTVISPGLCDRLRTLDDAGSIRYIPRKYFRGDCTPAVLCVAATNDRSVNIAISVECKAKNIPVHLSDPAAFGNFMFPETILRESLQISAVGTESPAVMRRLMERLERRLPQWLEEARLAEQDNQKEHKDP